MNQEELEVSLEYLRRLGEDAGAAGEPLRKLAVELKKYGTSISNTNQAIDQQTENFKNLNDWQRAYDKTVSDGKQRQEAFNRASDAAGHALGSMTLAVLDSERNFKKYGSALSSFGDTAQKVGEGLGGVYKAAGLAIKGLTFVGQKALEQADNVVTATDSLRKMGGIADGVTSEAFLNLAHNAGITSKNLDMLVKPLQELGPAIIGLGSSAGEGQRAFAQIAAVGPEVRKEFRRLGLTQEELIESQAAYMELQDATGQSMRRAGETETQRINRLQKESLDYTRNLTELAALTGKNVEQLQKEQEAAQAEFTFMIHLNKLQEEEAELRRRGLDDQADAVKKRREAEQDLVNTVKTAGFDESTLQGLRQSIATGGAVFSEETAALARMMGQEGKSMNDILSQARKGVNVSSEFVDTASSAIQKGVNQLGTAMEFGGKELGKQFGVSEQNLQAIARRRGISEEQAREDAANQRRKASQAGLDPAMDARAQLTELEIKAGVALDSLLASANPLVKGFTATTVAATAAAAALSAMAVSALFKSVGGLKGLGGMAKGAAGKMLGTKGAAAVAKSVGPAASTAGRVGSTAMRGLGRLAPGAGVLAAGAGVYQAVGEGRERKDDIEARKQAGLLDEEAATRARRASSAKTAGQSVGVAGGAIAGGLKGAAIGAALGPVGAAVGGLIGAGLGAWAGKNAGKLIGGAIGEGIGESVRDQDFGAEVKKDQTVLDAMRMAGSSDEEISHMERQLEINQQLKEAQENKEYGTMKLLLLQRELNDAKFEGNTEEIQELENLLALETKANEQRENAQAIEAQIKDLREVDPDSSILKILEKQLESQKESLAETEKQTKAIYDRNRAEELSLKIKEMEQELEDKGGSFGSKFDPAARAKSKELEEAKKELEEINKSGVLLEQAEQPADQAESTAGDDQPVRRSMPTMGGLGDSNIISASGDGQMLDEAAIDNTVTLARGELQNQLQDATGSNLQPGGSSTGESQGEPAGESQGAPAGKSPSEPTGAEQGDIRMGVKRYDGNFSEARFAENDPEGYQAWNDFKKEEFNRLFEELKAEMPPGFRNNRSLVSKERDKARMLSRDSAVIEFKEAIEAAGAGTVELLQAAKGGVFSGPEKGFPVQLHGTELVAPLDPNSILMELAQTSATDTGSGTEPAATEEASDTLERNADITAEMMQMLSDKLDVMISALETGNEVSDQILKQSY